VGLPTNISVQFLKILNSGATRLLDKIPSWPTNNYLADHQLTTPIPLFRPSHHHDLSGLQTIPSLPLLHLTDHHMTTTQHSYRPSHDHHHTKLQTIPWPASPPYRPVQDHHHTTLQIIPWPPPYHLTCTHRYMNKLHEQTNHIFTIIWNQTKYF